jgi:tetratricopeptide (TPR) repeat protein
MTDTTSQRDRVWILIEDARRESDHEAANILFRDAEQIARVLDEIEPDNAEHCYAVALTYYHRSDSPEKCRKCLEWLGKTEELDPSHPWMPLYRGYQYFDEGRFREAYEEFARVDQSYFANIAQHCKGVDRLGESSTIYRPSQRRCRGGMPLDPSLR